MNTNQRFLLVTFFMLFITPLSHSRGMFGSYELKGKVYDSKGTLLRNQRISVYDGKETQEIQSDENGAYVFKVFYGTACRSGKQGGSIRKTNKEMNNRKLIFSYKGETVEIHTNWKKGYRVGTINRTLKLK